jgi:hypothetical protein
MVRVDTVDEIREKREMEKAPPAEKFSALDYTKAIASTLALDGGSIASLIKDGRIGWLKYTENMSAGDLAKTIATLVIFSAVGNLKPTKSGAISFAKTKGNAITPSFKEKVEKAVEKYNEQPRGKQLEGLQKIRQSSVDALTSLLRDTKNKADIQTIKGELAEATKKLNETKENVKAEVKRNADEVAQVERIKERVRQENQKTKFEKENDAKVADYIKRKEAYDAKVKEILKNNPNAFKTKVSAKTAKERREIEMMDIFRDPAEVAREQAEIARLKKEGLELEQEKGLLDSQAKQAEAKESGGVDSKASESKTEKPNNERQGSKEVPPTKKAPTTSKAPEKAPAKTTKEQAEKQAEKETKERRDKETKEALEKSEREDKPDFSDPPNETEPLLEKSEGKEKTIEETIDSQIELNRQEREASSKVSKAATVGTAATIVTEVVDKLTNTKERNPRRTFEVASGFTNKPVVEGEEGTQSTNEPTPAPSPAPTPSTVTASISFTNHKEKRTQNTENIDELFSITIKACTDVYDNKIGEERNYFYFGKFDIPVLFFISQKILYIAFRGTKLNFSSLEDSKDSIRNILTDLTTSDFIPFKNNNNSNFLNRHEPFNKILDHVASNIEFSLGVILSLKISYPFIIDRIKDIDHSINSIVVTGHSLGGAMAQLFTYVYNNSIENKYNKIPIKHLVTYGQPRILFDKPEYIRLFNDSVKGYHRVWNTQDPICYLPLKKKVTVENMLGSEIASGYVHVGDSFDLSGNIVNNNVNLLLYEILKGNKEKIEMLLDSKDLLTNSKLLKFMLSDKFLSLQLYTYYECLNNVEVKEEITQEQITFLTRELQKDTSKLLSYAEKCDLLKPYGISEILKMNPIGDDLDEENFSIACMFGVSLGSCKVGVKAHKLDYYHELLDKLIARQIDEKKPIFEVIDKVQFYEPRKDLFKNVEGIIEGDFQNGEFITF